MKIDDANPSPDTTPHGLKGVNVRATRHGTVIQALPRKGAQQWTLLQEQYRRRFAIAARMASNPTELEANTAIEMAKGTEQVPRDILTMAALGNYYIIRNPDGTEWPHVQGPIVPTAPDPGPDPDPGPTDEDGFEMQWNQWDNAFYSLLNTEAYAFKGSTFTPEEAFQITHMGAVLKPVSGQTYRMMIAAIDGSDIITDLTLGATFTTTDTTLRAFVSELGFELTAGQKYCAMVGRVDGTGTNTMPVQSTRTAAWLWPCIPGTKCRLAETVPANGQTVSVTASTQVNPIGFRLVSPA